MSGAQRSAILAEIFQRFPRRFRPEQAGSTTAVIHWTVTGRPDGGSDTYQLVIEHATCTVSDRTDREPHLVITVGPVGFLQLISGASNPMMMFLTGKVKATGDLGLATRIGQMFAVGS